MEVVASGHPPVVPRVEVQLSVRHGREAVAFYEAAFGAQTCFRLGGTGRAPRGGRAAPGRLDPVLGGRRVA